MLTPILVLSVALQAREPGSEVDRMATQERLDQPGWWPTKLLPSRKDLVGPEACAKCHPAITASAKDSEMAKALLRPEDSEVLRTREGQGFQLESYLYKLEHTPQSYEFSVRQGPDSSTQPITWAFGDGSISQVYVTDVHGTYYESHFSYYGGTDGFDRTTNQPHRAESLQSAVGRSMMPVEIRNCFSCHSAGVTSKGDFNNVIPGVTCEACHGPGADHVAAMKAGVEGGEGMIMNPGRLDRTASVDFCGACHMTWIDVQMGDVKDEASVRFPAYRLENSRCWAKGDKRITCVGCHDPHRPVVRDSTFYDQKCLGCHLATAATKPSTDHIGKACPQSDRDCISCHMPKREFPDTHHSFTDHYIRVVRTSAAAAGR
jgi:hypothetical protein